MSRSVLVALALASGCASAVIPPPATDAGGGDGAAGVMIDAGLGQDAPENQAPAYRQFVRQREAAWQKRRESCFKVPAEAAEPSVSPALVEGLARDRVRFDPGRAAACLAELEARPCDVFLSSYEDPQRGCAAVLEGLVPAGEPCAADEECRDPDRACTQPDPLACSRRCLPPAALGEDCSGRPCAAGTVCHLAREPGTPRHRCVQPPGPGAACEGPCAAGLFCAREAYDGFEGIDEGVCRPRTLGGACKNDWQCPLPLDCQRAAGAAQGSCGPAPRALGQECLPGQSQCPPGTACRALGSGFACQAWPGLGGACGYLEVGGQSEAVGCAAGVCDLTAGLRQGICAAAAPATPLGNGAGAACDHWNRCGTGLRCQAGRCQAAACDDPGAALGVVPDLEPAGRTRMVLVHGPASKQPTPLGRRLATLEPWMGRIYVGYGDYEANTGPISLAALDPGAGTLSEEFSLDSEAVALFRPLGDKLYAPAIDPRGPVAYAAGPPWAAVTSFVPTHVFDLAVLGDQLFAVGSLGTAAVVWRSGDGGATFSESLRQESPGFFMRYYFAATLAGKLYVQAVPSVTGQSRVFDGTSWQPGPNLLPRGGQGWNPRIHHGQLVYLSWQPIGPQGGTLMAFDGTAARRLLEDEVLDFAVRGDTVHVLTAAGRVMRSNDLGHWWTLGIAPRGARSIAVLEPAVYLGGTEARLFVLEAGP